MNWIILTIQSFLLITKAEGRHFLTKCLPCAPLFCLGNILRSCWAAISAHRRQSRRKLRRTVMIFALTWITAMRTLTFRSFQTWKRCEAFIRYKGINISAMRLGSEVADTPFSVQMLCISSASFLQNNFFVMSRGQTKVQGTLVLNRGHPFFRSATFRFLHIFSENSFFSCQGSEGDCDFPKKQ